MAGEEVARKVQQMMLFGYGKATIFEALRLMDNAHWRSMVVEQGHGSLATIHKAHRYYSKEMLGQRAMVHMMLCLVAPDSQEQQLSSSKLEEALSAKLKSSPH